MLRLKSIAGSLLLIAMTVAGLTVAQAQTGAADVIAARQAGSEFMGALGGEFNQIGRKGAARGLFQTGLAAQVMGGAPPLEGPVELRVTIYLPIPASWSRKRQQLALDGLLLPTTKPDWDNAAKITDAVNGILWRDDSQVTDAHIFKRYSDRPRVVIEVRPIVGKLP